MNLAQNPIYKTLDWLWRLVVKGDKNRCEVCESRDILECHHIITRGDLWLRWEPKNGILACRKCHERPDLILDWLILKDPERYTWLIEKKVALHHGLKIDLILVEKNLRAII